MAIVPFELRPPLIGEFWTVVRGFCSNLLRGSPLPSITIPDGLGCASLLPAARAALAPPVRMHESARSLWPARLSWEGRGLWWGESEARKGCGGATVPRSVPGAGAGWWH